MYSCEVVDRRSLRKTIKARGHEVPKTVVEVSVYLAGKKLDVCDEQVEHGGMFWPQTMKVSQCEIRNETNLRDPPSCSHIRLFSLLSYRSSLHFSKRLHARS